MRRRVNHAAGVVAPFRVFLGTGRHHTFSVAPTAWLVGVNFNAHSYVCSDIL
jgi:hypothetical protein